MAQFIPQGAINAASMARLPPPFLFLLLFQVFQLAFITKSIVAANGPAASGAFPLFFLMSQEHIDTKFLDILKVFYHAHVVFIAVALVELLEALTGELFTFKAVFYTPLPYQFTPLDKVAVFPPGTASGTILLLYA
jgi:hypothetical protein